MTSSGLGLIVAVALLAIVNGANDTFKGVATLWGSGVRSYRGALWWGVISTLAGALGSLTLASLLATRFGGKGLVPDAVVADPSFALAVAIGALTTVGLAVWWGLPISTTHGLLGGLIGAGLVEAGVNGLNLSALGKSYLLPLLLSPVVAAMLAGGLQKLLQRWPAAALYQLESCLCVEPVVASANQAPALSRDAGLVIDDAEKCDDAGLSQVGSVRVASLLDGAHLLAAGAVGFARGLNDAPKIFGLMALAPAMRSGWSLTLVALAMALGGALFSRKIAQRVSFDITSLDGVSATLSSFVTASLVIGASVFAWPVSTTHVSCGSLFGIGAATRTGRLGTIRTIALAWLATLPIAAVLAATTMLLLRR